MALRYHRQLESHRQPFPISQASICSLLQKCTKTKDLKAGRGVYSFLISNGLENKALYHDYLIRMFAVCGCLSDSVSELHKLTNPSPHAWHAAISAHATHGECHKALELYQHMQDRGVTPDKFVLLHLLKACRGLGIGRILHDQVVRSGLESNIFVGSTLIDLYARCEALAEAYKLFEQLPNRNAVAWNAIMSGYAKIGHGFSALTLFQKMQDEGFGLCARTYSCILKACCTIQDVGTGSLIHCQILFDGLEEDIVLGSSLIDMYIKCSMLQEAHKVFELLKCRDLLSWNGMIAGCVQHGQGHSALELYEKMQNQGKTPDKFTFSCIPKACGMIKGAEMGREIHGRIIMIGLELDDVIGNALVDMYAKCGCLDDARSIFDSLGNGDLVAWNTMFAGYAQHGHGLLALELFERFQLKGLHPDQATLSCILRACGLSGAIGHGLLVHHLTIRHGFEINTIVGNTLVDMYARCGIFYEAVKVLKNLLSPTLVSWGSLLAGYALHGRWGDTWHCLGEMQQHGVKPDGMIFTSIFTACSHAGKVEEGYQYFKSLKDEYGIVPTVEHFNCMVDLLGRSGFLGEAEQLLHSSPFLPDVVGWRCLLSACKTYGNNELGKKCFDQIVHLCPDIAAGFMIISNIYANNNDWGGAGQIQDLRKCIGAWKKPGRACVEIMNILHEFTVDEPAYLHHEKAYSRLCRVKRMIEEAGYVPQVDSVLDMLPADSDDELFWVCKDKTCFESAAAGYYTRSCI